MDGLVASSSSSSAAPPGLSTEEHSKLIEGCKAAFFARFKLELLEDAQASLDVEATQEQKEAWALNVSWGRFWDLAEDEQDEVFPDSWRLRADSNCQPAAEVEEQAALSSKQYSFASDVIQGLSACCNDAEEAVAVLCRVVRGLGHEMPELSQRLCMQLDSERKEIEPGVRTLLHSLGRFRTHVRCGHEKLLPLLDDAVLGCGLFSRVQQLRTSGYDITPAVWRDSCERLRGHGESSAECSVPRRKRGRPSIVDDPECVQKALNVLIANTTETSRFITLRSGTGKEIRPVRTTGTTLDALWESSGVLVGSFCSRTFRNIQAKHAPEIKKGDKRVDICDHCHQFEHKIYPEWRRIVDECKRAVAEVYPEYWRPYENSSFCKAVAYIERVDEEAKWLIWYLENFRKKRSIQDVRDALRGTG